MIDLPFRLAAYVATIVALLAALGYELPTPADGPGRHAEETPAPGPGDPPGPGGACDHGLRGGPPPIGHRCEHAGGKPGPTAPTSNGPGGGGPTKPTTGGGGYAGPSTPGPVGPASAAGGPSTPGPAGPGSPGPGGGGGGRYRGGPGGTYVGPGDSSPPSAGLLGVGHGAVSTGSDDFFLGFGEQQGRALSPADVDALVRRFFDDCRRRPGETPEAMFFRYWGDNPCVPTFTDRLSTFAADVDTASYSLARNYLSRGYLPTKEQVRTEEFVNALRGDVPPPVDRTFAVHLELAPSPFGDPARNHWMLRVAVRGRDVQKLTREPLALTFVVDTSGSMAREDRIELVKHSLRLLLGELDERDTVSIVTFSNEARLVLPPTSAGQRAVIESAVHGLRTGGGTNAEAGLVLGYAQAELAGGGEMTTRVVLLSDGVANIGNTTADAMLGRVARYREHGIYLNTYGVGMGNHNDALLERLADRGDGLCAYIDTPKEARRRLVDELTASFVPIARDLKIQVEFNPAQVLTWRQLGYENRAIADQDFRNDRVDAGEIGAGHQVVALYELERANVGPDPCDPLATVRLRWKTPERGDGERVFEFAGSTRARHASGTFAGTTPGFRRSALVAQFAEVLRRSRHARGDSFARLMDEAVALHRETRDGELAELCGMLGRSRDLIAAEATHDRELSDCLEAVQRNHYLRAQFDCLAERTSAQVDREAVERLERENEALEQHIRAMLLERSGGDR